jgi:ABC-2 type transport system permease protein
MRALGFLLRKEFLQIFRDRMIVRILFLVPIAQLLVLANAATFEVTSARLYVVDRDHSSFSRGLVTRLAASGRFVPVGQSASMPRADAAMLDRSVDAILVVPANFERDLMRSHSAPVQLILNAEDGAAAAVTQSYASQIIATWAQEIMAETRLVVAGANRVDPVPMIEVRRRGWYNPRLEYRDYMVPGILVVLVTVIGTLLTAMNIVREKETGTLDQLNVTPVSRSVFVAAKLIPLWSLALVVLGVGILIGWAVLGVPIRGNLLLVFGAAALYLIGALGIGLWVSAVVETQQQALFVSYAILMVYLLMSGLFTPVSAMPPWAQWVAEASPVKHFAQLLRAVLLKGAGPADVLRELGVLAAIGSAVLTLAVRQYHKRAN